MDPMAGVFHTTNGRKLQTDLSEMAKKNVNDTDFMPALAFYKFKKTQIKSDGFIDRTTFLFCERSVPMETRFV